MKSSKKRFLKLPEYPGGKEAFRAYIKSNLKYPKKALEQRVQGIVYLSAEINDNGEVLEVNVENGIGAGCDEEAIRLIKNVRFGVVNNHGLRVKSKKKFRIEFKLPPENKISYHLVSDKKNTNQTKAKIKYSYSINLNNEK